MNANIRDILIITRADCMKNFFDLLGNGNHLGIDISYEIQENPKGIAEALLIGEKFIGSSKCVLILGDNIFIGPGLNKKITDAINVIDKSTIFCVEVESPEDFGVLNLENGKPISIEEKPSSPKSNLAVTGLYVYDKFASSYSKSIKSSARGELEITSLNNIYLNKNKLDYVTLDDGDYWYDAGTFESLFEVSSKIKLEVENNNIISSPEKIALKKGWINKDEFRLIVESMKNSTYGQMLKSIE